MELGDVKQLAELLRKYKLEKSAKALEDLVSGGV